MSEAAGLWLLSLPEEVRKKLARKQFLLESYGPSLAYPHVDKIQDGLFELRVQAEGGWYRLFFDFASRRRIAAADGDVKKRPRFTRTRYDLAARRVRDFREKVDDGYGCPEG